MFGAHFIPNVNSSNPALEFECSRCTEVNRFSLLLLGNEMPLCLAPREEGFAVHAPGKFLLAGSQENGSILSSATRCCNYCTCVSSHFKALP